ESQSADVRDPAGQCGASGRTEELERRISSSDLSRYAISPGRYTDPAFESAGRHERRAATQQTGLPQSIELPLRARESWRHGAGSAYRRVRAGVQDAVVGAGSGRPEERERRYEEALWSRRGGDGCVWRQLPAGAPAGGARSALRRVVLRVRQRVGRA